MVFRIVAATSIAGPVELPLLQKLLRKGLGVALQDALEVLLDFLKRGPKLAAPAVVVIGVAERRSKQRV